MPWVICSHCAFFVAYLQVGPLVGYGSLVMKAFKACVVINSVSTCCKHFVGFVLF